MHQMIMAAQSWGTGWSAVRLTAHTGPVLIGKGRWSNHLVWRNVWLARVLFECDHSLCACSLGTLHPQRSLTLRVCKRDWPTSSGWLLKTRLVKENSVNPLSPWPPSRPSVRKLLLVKMNLWSISLQRWYLSVLSLLMFNRAVPPGPPIARVATTSDHSIDVEWDPPADTGGGDILGYHVDKVRPSSFFSGIFVINFFFYQS